MSRIEGLSVRPSPPPVPPSVLRARATAAACRRLRCIPQEEQAHSLAIERSTPAPAAVVFGDLNLVRCLRKARIPLALLTTDPDEPALRSRHCRTQAVITSLSEPDGALCDLITFGQRLGGRATFFYGNDAMLLLLSRYRRFLRPYFRMRLPEPALVEQLVNKQRFTHLAERLNLPVPETLTSSELSNPDDVLRGLSLPCVLKPADSTGWLDACSLDGAVPAKALRADSEEQLRQVFWKAKLCGGQFVVQTFVPGGEEHLVSYHAYIGADRQVLGEFVGRKVRTYPRESGVSTCLELAKMPDVLALGREIVEQLNMVGPVKIDFKRSSRDGRLYLLEVNARFTLWNYLGARCGVNLPALAHADLTGRRLRPAFSYRTGLRWISAANDLRAYVREYRSAGRLSFLRWAYSYAGPAAYDVFSWTDPMPSAASLALYAKALTTRLLLGVPMARLRSKPH